MIDPRYENRIRRASLWASAFCLLSVIPPLLSLLGSFKPQAEPAGQWFERSGAVMTAFAVFAQFKAGGIASLIQGTTFAESWEAYRKYKAYQASLNILSLSLIIVGTLIWGYGDLLLPFLCRYGI